MALGSHPRCTTTLFRAAGTMLKCGYEGSLDPREVARPTCWRSLLLRRRRGGVHRRVPAYRRLGVTAVFTKARWLVLGFGTSGHTRHCGSEGSTAEPAILAEGA